jgi:xanthine dehydrogenase YagR molybdenum-binding subunit
MTEAAPEPRANMGQPVPRVDARAKVTGEARYPSDVPVTGAAYAFLVTSAIAKGRIAGMDLSAARAVPGVLDIITQDDAAALNKVEHSSGSAGASTSIQHLGPDIAHDGQIVAMVVAETFEAAREAAYRMRVDYAPETPSAGFDAPGATEQDVTRKQGAPQLGDADAALAKADVVVNARYSTPTQHHNPIELFTTTCAWSGDELTVYEPSQFVTGIKNHLAKALGIDAAKVRVVSPYVGGAFGAKGQLTPRTALVALAARKLGRPMKLVPTRDQGFTIATYRAETRHHVRLGADRSGRILGYAHQGWEVTSRPDDYVLGGVDDTARLYGFGAVKTRVTLVHADRNTPGFMRSPQVLPYLYALESAMDELAVALGMDPVALRRINDTMSDPISGKAYSSRGLMRCFDEAAAAFGWAGRDPRPGSMRDGDWLVGWGCASAFYPTHIAVATARVRLDADGAVTVRTAAHDLGTGAYTVIGQMAAERLGVKLERVTVALGDSSLPAAPTAGGSNTTASVCSAVMKACDGLLERLFRTAATANDSPLAGRDPSALRLESGRVVAAGAEEALADVLARLGGAIDEYAEFVPKGLKPDAIARLYKGKGAMTGGSQGDRLMYAFGAEFVEVRINAYTREIRVPRLTGAFAAGRIMNPRTARSQLMGGLIWGVSSALHEATEIDTRHARYVNDNIAEYLIPVNADIQDVEVNLVPEVDEEVNPAGVKGLAELGNVGTAAAVANAVYHATGKRLRDLPIRIDDLLD